MDTNTQMTHNCYEGKGFGLVTLLYSTSGGLAFGYWQHSSLAGIAFYFLLVVLSEKRS